MQHRLTLALALGLAGSLATSAALASEPFPDAMKGDLDLTYTPGCDLCHQHAAAPVGPADKPFAKSLEARGLVAGDLDSLATALEKDKGVDSDGDGAEDLDELSWGGDPNHADLPVGKPPPKVSYGCGAQQGQSASFGALAFCAGFVALRRRRTTRRR